MKILVTGASGFLGKALIEALCKIGHEVIGVSRAESAFKHEKFKWVSLDLSILSEYDRLDGSFDAVIHTAAKAGYWGDYSEYYQSNCLATQNLVQKSIEWSVTSFVFTSSPSVVFDGNKNLQNVDESTPYPKKYFCHYSQTKMLAEKMVLENCEKLRVVSLRPHLIYGPGDHHLLPRVIDKASKGNLKMIGMRDVQVDVIYIDNCVEGHIQALNVLAGDDFRQINGKAYFISDEKPVFLWSWINSILNEMNLKKVQSKVSYKFAYSLGRLFELLYKSLRISKEPPLTRFVVNSLATDHYFNQTAARKDFGYKQKVNEKEAFKRTVLSLKNTI